MGKSWIWCLLAFAPLDVTAFDKPFIPTNSTPYNPMVSSTFQRTRGRFALSYADKTHLNGYVGQDVVQVLPRNFDDPRATCPLDDRRIVRSLGPTTPSRSSAASPSATPQTSMALMASWVCSVRMARRLPS